MDQLQAQPDEGYSEETQSSTGDYVDAMRLSKPLSDTAQALSQTIEHMSPEDKLSVLRYALTSLSVDQQTGMLSHMAC